jgi:molybdenum cofactor biosynthesis enzyme MoaA
MLQAEHVADVISAAHRKDIEAQAQLLAWRNRFSRQDAPLTGREDKCTCGGPKKMPFLGDVDLGEEGYTLWLELVEACNLDCVFCYNPWRPDGSPMRGRRTLSSADYVDIVSSIMSSVDVRYVTLSGGEPLLFTALDDLLATIRERACENVGMTTNGRSLTRHRLSSLVKGGLTQISVPVHSHRPDVHNELAAGNSWKAAVRALALGIEHGIAVTLSSVVTSKNLCDILRVVDIVKYLGIRCMTLNCMHETGQGADRNDLSVSADVFGELLSRVREALEGRAQVIVGSPPASQTSLRDNTVDRLVLSPYGDIKLCNQSYRGVLNVLDSQDEFLSFLTALREHSYDEYVVGIDHCLCRAIA